MYFDKTTHPNGGFTASEDIVCYKVLRERWGNYASPFYSDKTWKVGELCKTEIKEEKCGVIKLTYFYNQRKCWRTALISEKEHKANIEGKIYSTYAKIESKKVYGLGIIENGFYCCASFMNFFMRNFLDNMMLTPYYIGRFTIPKGSRYYVGDDAITIVSDTLRFDGVVGGYKYGKFFTPNF